MEGHGRSQSQEEIKDHVPINYILEDNLAIQIKEKMEDLSLSGSISRVSEANGEHYFPVIVSIGPFHHGKDSLKAMQDKKWFYLNTLLSRNLNSTVEASLEKCVKRLRHLEGKARKCYAENIDMESDEFVEMMLVDGCFIIELFLKSAIKGLKCRDDSCFAPDRLHRLTSDLILLENQIPFFILEQLFHLVPIPKQCNLSPSHLALRFFRRLIPGPGEIPPERIIPNTHHFLDLIRHFYLPTIPELQEKGGQKGLKSATNIQSAGIKFRKGTAENLLNIKFENRVLRIPPLKTNIYTETLLRNLIALENCCSRYTKHITSYIFLMGCLVQSENDLKLLQSRGILIIPSEKQNEILDVFKKIQVNMNLKDFYYKGLCEQVNSHQSSLKFQLSFLCCKS